MLSPKAYKSRHGSKTIVVENFTEEQVLPIVKREVSKLAKQRLKVRDPTDFLKVQQRIKHDLDSLNNQNAFFRQRYTAYMESEKAMDGGGDSARQHSYRPRPYVDARQNSLANYDEYLVLKEIERKNQSDLRSFLMHQIKARQTELRQHPSRQPALAETAKPQPVESIKH